MLTSASRALTDVATASIIHDRVAADQDAVDEQLQTVLDTRVLLEQAKGTLAQAGGLAMPDAYAAPVLSARDHNLKLGHLARALVEPTVPRQLILDHADRRTRRHRPRAPQVNSTTTTRHPSARPMQGGQPHVGVRVAEQDDPARRGADSALEPVATNLPAMGGSTARSNRVGARGYRPVGLRGLDHTDVVELL